MLQLPNFDLGSICSLEFPLTLSHHVLKPRRAIFLSEVYNIIC